MSSTVAHLISRHLPVSHRRGVSGWPWTTEWDPEKACKKGEGKVSICCVFALSSDPDSSDSKLYVCLCFVSPHSLLNAEKEKEQICLLSRFRCPCEAFKLNKEEAGAG